MSRKLNIRPTSGVYATYKRLSYQPWTAIAEFVDNSTQSFYDHKDELMQIKYYKELRIDIEYREDSINGDSLIVTDNAFGMEWSDFQRAVVLDKPPKKTSGRNEFGMGLKTAACWFGSLWSVESTQYNSKNKFYAEIDIDLLEKYKNEEIDVQEETVSPSDHYTRITVRRLNKKISGPRTIGKVKELLSSIYREDIRSGLVKIYYNGNLLQFKEAPVFFEENNGEKHEWKKEIAFEIIHEGAPLAVQGFVALRIPGSVKDAGLTLLRRGRVIVGGSEKNYRPTELFGDSNSYAWQRLYGELHMDNWPVTQAKDAFDWHNSGLEEAFITELEKHTQDYRRKAENIRVRERIDTKDLIKAAVGDLTTSGLIENVEVKIIERTTPATQPIQAPENGSNEDDAESRDNAEQILQEVIVNTNDGGVEIDGGEQVDYRFKYKNIDYFFHIIFDTQTPSAHWLVVEQISDSEYTLIINMRHSFFKPLIEKKEFLPVMTRMCISLVLAEIESLFLSPDGRIDATEIRLKMNEILESIRRGDTNVG